MSEHLTITITPVGRLDSANAGALQKEVAEKLAGHAGSLVFDLSSLDYISSAGLRVLLIAAKATQAKGSKTILVSPKPLVSKILEMGGFDKIIEVRASLEG
jgi:anti-anti-sigma factor